MKTLSEASYSNKSGITRKKKKKKREDFLKMVKEEGNIVRERMPQASCDNITFTITPTLFRARSSFLSSRGFPIYS